MSKVRFVFHWAWEGWVFFMTWIILPISMVLWAVDPIWFGQPWGVIIAIFIAIETPFIMYQWLKDHGFKPKKRDLRS